MIPSLKLILAAIISAFPVCAQPASSNDKEHSRPIVSEEVDRLIRTSASHIDPDSKVLEIRRQLREMGPPILPVLKQLFEENENDAYRAVILGTMFEIQGGTSTAVDFVVSQLSKPPEEWPGNAWIFQALNHLEHTNLDKARWGALRVLESEDDRFLRSSALGRLERIGLPTDIPALVSFRLKRQKEGGELRTNVLKWIDLAIAGIEKRKEESAMVGNTSIPSATVGSDPAAAATSRTPSPITAESGPKWLLIIVLTAIVIAGLVIGIARRHK